MRKPIKFLHTIASCGLIGALGGYLAILMFSSPLTAQAYAEMRQTINILCKYMLFPSLAVSLLSGLIAMMVHRPFQEMRWVWAKAVLGLSMFEGTLVLVQARAAAAAEEAARIAAGGGEREALAVMLANEWLGLGVVLGLSTAQVALGIWRPRLGQR